MIGPVFVDTNVIVYRFDARDPGKQVRAGHSPFPTKHWRKPSTVHEIGISPVASVNRRDTRYTRHGFQGVRRLRHQALRRLTEARCMALEPDHQTAPISGKVCSGR